MKVLSVISHGIVTVDKGRMYVDEAFGRLLDGLASHFNHIFYIASCADRRETRLYPGERSLFTYEFQSTNVSIVPAATIYTHSLFDKIVKFPQKIKRLFSYIRRSDLVYIFMPGFTGIFASFISIIFRKPYFVYFASDWQEVAQYTSKWQGITKIFYPLYVYISKFAEKYSSRYALFILVHGKRVLEKFQNLGTPTYETVPMVALKREDFYFRKDTCQNNPAQCIFVGSVIPRKGLEYLIDSLKLLRERGIDVVLNIIGEADSQYHNFLKEKIKELDIKERVIFHGYIKDKDVLLKNYRACDIFVLPTLGEGFPRVIYEAMSQGLPVVTTKIDTIAQSVSSEYLKLVDPRSAEDLAKGIEEIIKDGQLRQSLIRKGYEYLDKRLINSTPQDQVVELIKQHNG